MVVLAFLSSSNVEAFAPRPAATPHIRSVPKMAPRIDPFSIARWERSNDVEAELVDDAFDATLDSLKRMQMGQENPIKKKTMNPTPALFTYFQELSGKHTAFAAVVALALTLFLTPLPSMAAMSGGRMGGSFSAPRQSSGSVVPRSSYSRGFSSGYGGGYYSRGPTIMVNPFPMVTPFTPFYSPFGFGSPGVVTYSSGPGFFSLLLLGGFAFAVMSALSGTMNSVASSWSEGSSSSLLGSSISSALGSGTSVVQVTVGLEVPNRDDPNSILSALGRLAKTARTDSRVGIQNLTSQVALELLRRKNSIVSASTKYKHFNDRSTALREFNSRSIKERSKFESETLSNYGGVDYGSRRGGGGESGSDDKATMAVVTILLSIDGDKTKVPQIRSVGDVEDALRMIASDSKVNTCLQAAEILWTPEDRSESLSARDVVADYPELRSV